METVQVFVRFRDDEGEAADWVLTNTLVSDSTKAHTFTFDRIFSRQIGQAEVFDESAKNLLASL